MESQHIDQLVFTVLRGWQEEFYLSIHRTGSVIYRKRKGPLGIPVSVRKENAAGLFRELLQLVEKASLQGAFLKATHFNSTLILLQLSDGDEVEKSPSKTKHRIDFERLSGIFERTTELSNQVMREPLQTFRPVRNSPDFYQDPVYQRNEQQ